MSFTIEDLIETKFGNFIDYSNNESNNPNYSLADFQNQINEIEFPINIDGFFVPVNGIYNIKINNTLQFREYDGLIEYEGLKNKQILYDKNNKCLNFYYYPNLYPTPIIAHYHAKKNNLDKYSVLAPYFFVPKMLDGIKKTSKNSDKLILVDFLAAKTGNDLTEYNISTLN